MIDLAADALTSKQRYDLLVGAVVPRPIAWVTTKNRSGSINLAPFSCYMFICGSPPQIAIAMGSRAGQLKDTLRNIVHTGEFVINAVTEELLPDAARSSRPYPPDVSEVTTLGIELAPELNVDVPRIAASPVAFECSLANLIPMHDSDSHHLVIGRILCFRIRDDLLRDGRIDVNKFLPIARLGGSFYARLGEILRVDTDQPRVGEDAARADTPLGS